MLLSRSANTSKGVIPLEGKHSRTLRNSDRIKIKFGNYGIDIIENDIKIRVSSLYSIQDGIKTNRTFAVVAYPGIVDAAFRKEHEAIISGQSIGIVFEHNGWAIEKHHQYLGEIKVPDRHSGAHTLFGGTGTGKPAIHIYSLVVRKDGSEFEYASIAEVHHPAFLQLEDLKTIYGLEHDIDQAPDKDVAGFLEIVKTKLQEL